VRHRSPLDTVGFARAAASHDGVLLGGGGLIQDETGPFNVPFHLSRLAVGRLAGKPWAAVGLGVGSLHRRSSQLIVQAAMRSAVALSVRDRASQRRFARLTGDTAQLGTDPVMQIPGPATPPTPTLVVCLRPPNVAGQRRAATSPPPDRAVIETWAQAIDSIAADHQLDVAFVSWDRDRDEPVHHAVANAMTTPARHYTPNRAEVLGEIANASMVVTMRYHGLVAAALAQRPTVAINYSPKIGDLAEDFAGGIRIVAVDAPTPAYVDAARQVAKTQLTVAGPDIASRIQANRQVVQKLIAAAR